MSETPLGETLERTGASNTEHLTTFETDELTCNCPFEFGGPDFYTLTVKYISPGVAVESRSLKEYLERWRNKERTAEDLATAIHDDIEDTLQPESLYVRLEQARRGGIEETVEVGDYGLRE